MRTPALLLTFSFLPAAAAVAQERWEAPPEADELRSPYGSADSEAIRRGQGHGVTRLQGIVFHDGDLYLSGNIEVNDDLGTIGIVMRGALQPSGECVWGVVAQTVEHGGAQTTFDHGFNDIVVDLDGTHLLVNSGARTDHGEVQDNRGNYHGQREVPTTAVVLKLPIDGEDILLTHDEEQMAPYVFARGVRNIYSFAFAPNGDFFGVSNSGDYDHPEDMFWLREGHHYGFPWIMGGIAHDNYAVQATRLVDNLESPTDALLLGNEMYVINYAGSGAGSIWKLSFPLD